MKIRAGFVSNSSSTSFLIIAKEDLNKTDFFTLMGIEMDSPIAELFEQFYSDVLANSSKVDFAKAKSDIDVRECFGDRNKEMSEHMVERLLAAKKKGLKAYYGCLDSETNSVQTFFCTDSFEAENEKIYFNGLNCIW